MRILFLARHFAYFRNYDGALRELAARGHQIHLVVERHDRLGAEGVIEALARDHGLTFEVLPEWGADPQQNLVRRLRLGQDYLRYLEPFYDETPLLLERARERTPRGVISLATPPLIGGARWRRRLVRVLHAIDRALPPPHAVASYLRDRKPDVFLITPLVELGSQQIDFLRAARELGIPTGLCVWSWDHLSSKAYLREYPERVFVWNETQRREAVEGHGVPAEQVAITGAQCFDHWFDRRPSRTREEFCRTVDLPADRPLVLYVCSALILGSPPEPPFVRRWLERIRKSDDPRVARASVLVRPHPSHTAPWAGIDLSDLGPVAVWGGNPIDAQGRDDYFDSLYHSNAVVGLNTSAFIEAGIVGREVLTILPTEYHGNQLGTIHFRYLVEIGGGLLRVSRDFDEHIAQLAGALSRPPSADHPHREFLEKFVRPRGLGQAATPEFVLAVEGLRDCPVTPAGSAASPRFGKVLLHVVSRLAEMPALAGALLAPREADSLARIRMAEALKAQRRAEAGEERRQRLERRARQITEAEARRLERESTRERVQAAKALRAAQRLQEKARRVEEKRRYQEERMQLKTARRAEALRRKKWDSRRQRVRQLWRRVLAGAGLRSLIE